MQKALYISDNKYYGKSMSNWRRGVIASIGDLNAHLDDGWRVIHACPLGEAHVALLILEKD